MASRDIEIPITGVSNPRGTRKPTERRGRDLIVVDEDTIGSRHVESSVYALNVRDL
jgi:hypothetical protein